MARIKTYKDEKANEIPVLCRCQCKCGHCFDSRDAEVFTYNYGNVKTKYKACPRCGAIGFHYLYQQQSKRKKK